MYVTILIIGLAVFALFRFLYLLNRILPFSGAWKHYWGYLLPVVELASWLGFLVWCFRFIYDEQDYTPIIILGVLALLIILPLSFLLRDFLFGVILKLQRKMEIDQYVDIEGMAGKVVKAGYFSFDLKTKNGNVDTIPYNKIRSKVISKSGENIHLEKHKISFKIHSTENTQQIVSQLKTHLINSPWVAASQAPIMGEIYQSEGQLQIDVFVYTLQAAYLNKIRDYISRNIELVSI